MGDILGHTVYRDGRRERIFLKDSQLKLKKAAEVQGARFGLQDRRNETDPQEASWTGTEERVFLLSLLVACLVFSGYTHSIAGL